MLFVVLIISFVLLILLYVLYLKYGVEYRVKVPKKEITHPPSNLPPSIVGMLMSFGSFQDDFLTATIVDLINRGYISVEKILDGNRVDFILSLSKKIDNLKEFEKILLNKILFKNKNSVSVSFLRKATLDSVEEYQKYFEEFQKALEKEVDKFNFFDKRSRKISILITVSGLFIAIAGGILGALLNEYFWILLIPGFIYFIGGIGSISKRTREGKREFLKWRGFKDYLLTKGFNKIENEYIKNALIYSLPLGIYSYVLDRFKEINSKKLNGDELLKSMEDLVLVLNSLGTTVSSLEKRIKSGTTEFVE